MINLNYAIHVAPPHDADLRHVDEIALHYDYFLGDVVFQLNGADLSTSWGWVPIIDFAVCLARIAKDLGTRSFQRFEFTESEHRIDFTRKDDIVDIAASYGGHHAQVGHLELHEGAQRLLQRVFDDVMTRNPSLTENRAMREMRLSLLTLDLKRPR